MESHQTFLLRPCTARIPGGLTARKHPSPHNPALKTTVHPVTYRSVKPALILPALLLCLTACKKEEVQSLKTEAETTPPRLWVPSKEEDEDGPLLYYVFALGHESGCKDQISYSEGMLACKDEDYTLFYPNGPTKESIRSSLKKLYKDLEEATAKKQTAKETLLKTNPPPNLLARLEAHAAAMEKARMEYFTLDRELQMQGYLSYSRGRDKLLELQEKYAKIHTRLPSAL